MSATLLITFCGLIAAISWGTADFFAAKAAKTESAESTTLGVLVIGAVAFSLYYLVSHGSMPWTTAGALYAAAAGVFMGAGLLFFYRGLEVGPVSIVSPIGSAYPLVTTLIVITLLHGSLTALQIGGIVIVVTGLVLSCFRYSDSVFVMIRE